MNSKDIIKMGNLNWRTNPPLMVFFYLVIIFCVGIIVFGIISNNNECQKLGLENGCSNKDKCKIECENFNYDFHKYEGFMNDCWGIKDNMSIQIY